MPDQLPPDSHHNRVRRVWTVGTPVVFLLSGALFVTSAQSSDGTDLRPERYTDLSSLVSNEAHQVEDLRTQASDLNAEVKALTEAVGDKKVNRIGDQIKKIDGPAGFEAVSGQGVTVTLSDAPAAVQNSSDQPINYLVVHQQDIQAVVNAMWLGGAKAVTVQGQRLITTTGIKCSGNAVRLHGIPYAQPYVISAVGDTDALYAAIMNSRYLQYYRDQAAQPDIQVGWSMDFEFVKAPAYDGPMDLTYAQPVEAG
ncbi:MAG TPA: DUF881 domain-containing protein [Nocardioides sp.]|jgi:uncharacterized protein YlxW (UPF0749 family)